MRLEGGRVKDQKGFIVVLVMIVMSFTLLILTALIGLEQSDDETSVTYYDGTQANYLAEAGAKIAYDKIVYDENFRQNIKTANKAICFNSTANQFNSGSYQVDVLTKDDKIEIYAKGKCHKTERQVVLDLELLGNNNYKIICWKDC